MNDKVLKLLYLNRDLGETGLLPDGAIVNIGGVSGDNFTIGGKGVMLADGSTTGPDGTNLISLQKVYDNSPNGNLILNSDKGLSIFGSTNVGLKINGITGNVQIDSDLTINDVQITGLINGSINIQEFYDDFQNHVNNDTSVKHTARQISVANSDLTVITSENVQDAIMEIDTYLQNLSTIKSFVFEEINGQTIWPIQHNKNSLNPSITIFDETGTTIIPDEIKILDEDNIHVLFFTEQKGKAVIIFV